MFRTAHVEAQIRQTRRVRTRKDDRAISAVVVRRGARRIERSNHDIVDQSQRSARVSNGGHGARLLGAVADGVPAALELPVAGAEVVADGGVGEGSGVLGGVDEAEVLLFLLAVCRGGTGRALVGDMRT